MKGQAAATAALGALGLLAVASTARAQKLERALVPLVGGDTDIGIGAGAIGSLARPAAKEGEIFRWKLDFAAFGTLKSLDGKIGSPYQDVFLQFARKDLVGGRMRLELRAAYTRENNLRYYGLGNATVAPAKEEAARDFFERIHPAARASIQYAIEGPLELYLGAMYMQNWINVAPESTLLHDAEMGDPDVGHAVKLDRRHGLHVLQTALLFDSRDDEVSPSTGQHHIFQVRGSPWSTTGMPYRYIGISAAISGFAPLIRNERLVLAMRGVTDVLIGDVPFYELSRFDETSAIGGSKYVRGVPSNRYYGKRKVMGNLELRSRIFDFTAWKSKYQVGISTFFDTGRVWADLRPRPRLDGPTWGLKYGTGGGLRLQKGKTFVLRADLAWSPDARPVSGYVLADHIF